MIKLSDLILKSTAVLVVFFVLCGQVTDVAAQAELVDDGASKVGDTVYLEGVPLERIIDSDIVQVRNDPDDLESPLFEKVRIEYVSDTKPEILPNEILELRTPNTQVYDNRDGTYTMKYYLADVFTTDGLEWRYLDAKYTNQESFDAAFELAPLESSFFHTQSATAATTSGSVSYDTYLKQNEATVNFDTATDFWIQSRDASRNVRETINTTLPSGSGEITDVRLYVYLASGVDGGANADYVRVHAITQTDWVSAQATWNNYATGNAWSTAGGDFSSTVIDTIAQSSSAGWQFWEIMGDEATNPLTLDWESEIDLLLKYDNEGTAETYMIFRSEDYATASQRPYLEITYTAEAEPEPEPEPESNPVIVDMPYTQELTMITAMTVIYGTTTGTSTPLGVEYTYYHIPLIAWLIIAYLLMNSLWFIYAHVKNYDRRR